MAPPLFETLSAFAAGFVLMGLGFTLFLRGARGRARGRADRARADRDEFGPVWVWLAFGETPATATLVGGAIILAAVIAMAASGASAPAPNVSN